MCQLFEGTSHKTGEGTSSPNFWINLSPERLGQRRLSPAQHDPKTVLNLYNCMNNLALAYSMPTMHLSEP